MDEVFDFSELIFRILRRWRFIISSAVILAMLAAGYQAYSQIRNRTSAQNRISLMSGEDAALLQRVENLNTYARESILMKIDPYSEYVSSITFFVRSETLDKDNTADIANLYMLLYNDAKMYEKIKNNTGINIDSGYFRELISLSVSASLYTFPASSSSFEIRIIGDTPELTQAIAESVTSYYAEQNQRISQYVGEHSLETVSQGAYSTVNLSRITYQNNIQNGLNQLRSNIPIKPVNIKTVVTKCVLYAVMGGVGGIGISVLLLLFLDSVLMAALSDKDISKKYNLRFLGSVSSGGNRNV